MTESTSWWVNIVGNVMSDMGITVDAESIKDIAESIRRQVMGRYPSIAPSDVQLDEIARLKATVRRLKEVNL